MSDNLPTAPELVQKAYRLLRNIRRVEANQGRLPSYSDEVNGFLTEADAYLKKAGMDGDGA